MSISRFFVPPEAIVDGEAILPVETAHHAVQVLRLRVGDTLELYDNTGKGYRGTLTRASPKAATVQIRQSFTALSEPELRLFVAQALPKTTEKIEQVLQHGTEVGAAGFTLFAGARSVARLAEGDRDKIEKRLQRWQAIVQGAAEQSGRGRLPTVAWLPSARAVAAQLSHYDAALLLHESAETPLSAALKRIPAPSKMLLLVGPEGGFSDEEVALFAQQGASSTTLGPRILRTETAALVALAQVLYHYPLNLENSLASAGS